MIGADSTRLSRLLLAASPFMLIALGGWCLVRSPWPAIWRLMLKGEHVQVVYTWTTVGLPAVTTVCFALAIVISINIKRPDA